MEEIIHLILFEFSGKGQFTIQWYWKGHTTWDWRELTQTAGPEDSLPAA